MNIVFSEFQFCLSILFFFPQYFLSILSCVLSLMSDAIIFLNYICFFLKKISPQILTSDFLKRKNSLRKIVSYPSSLFVIDLSFALTLTIGGIHQSLKGGWKLKACESPYLANDTSDHEKRRPLYWPKYPPKCGKTHLRNHSWPLEIGF